MFSTFYPQNVDKIFKFTDNNKLSTKSTFSCGKLFLIPYVDIIFFKIFFDISAVLFELD